MFTRMFVVAVALALTGGAVAATDPIHQHDPIVMVSGAITPQLHGVHDHPMWTLLPADPNGGRQLVGHTFAPRIG